MQTMPSKVTRVDFHHHIAGFAFGLFASDAADDADLVNALAFEFNRDAQFERGTLDKLPHTVLHASGNDKIFSHFLLQHQPLHLHIIARMAPVAQRAHIAQVQAVLQAQRDAGKGPGDFAGDECFTAQWAFMVEQDAVAGIQAISLSVINGNPVGIHLGHRIRAAWVKRRAFFLRCFLHQAIQLTGAGLVEPGFFLQPQDADRLQQPQGANTVGIGGVFGRLKAHGHMAHGSQVVDFIGLHLLHDADQVG